MEQNLHHYKCGVTGKRENVYVDPITTQIIRNSLTGFVGSFNLLIVSIA